MVDENKKSLTYEELFNSMTSVITDKITMIKARIYKPEEMDGDPDIIETGFPINGDTMMYAKTLSKAIEILLNEVGLDSIVKYSEDGTSLDDAIKNLTFLVFNIELDKNAIAEHIKTVEQPLEPLYVRSKYLLTKFPPEKVNGISSFASVIKITDIKYNVDEYSYQIAVNKISGTNLSNGNINNTIFNNKNFTSNDKLVSDVKIEDWNMSDKETNRTTLSVTDFTIGIDTANKDTDNEEEK
jgi:hypothetical protein